VAKTHVLVVDDEPHILCALKATLQGAGYDVSTAATAEEALRLAAIQPPEAVVLAPRCLSLQPSRVGASRGSRRAAE
jgi:DNA-binding response OmpR family regulator